MRDFGTTLRNAVALRVTAADTALVRWSVGRANNRTDRRGSVKSAGSDHAVRGVWWTDRSPAHEPVFQWSRCVADLSAKSDAFGYPDQERETGKSGTGLLLHGVRPQPARKDCRDTTGTLDSC